MRQECEKQVNNSDPKEAMLTHRVKRMIKGRCVFVFFWVQSNCWGPPLRPQRSVRLRWPYRSQDTSGVSLR